MPLVSVIEMLKLAGEREYVVPPLTTVDGARSPVSVTLVTGFVVVLKISCPSKDNPSLCSVKYPLAGPKVSGLPEAKSTVKSKFDRLTDVVTGKLGGKAFGPVRLTISTSANGGLVMSNATYPKLRVVQYAIDEDKVTTAIAGNKYENSFMPLLIVEAEIASTKYMSE